jgi:hypothetical protein
MTALVRVVCLAGLLMGAIALPVAADQGRGDHDTPAMERLSDPISPEQYKARTCRTDGYGWVVCERNGRWWQNENQRRHRGYWDPAGGDDWIGRLLRL